MAVVHYWWSASGRLGRGIEIEQLVANRPADDSDGPGGDYAVADSCSHAGVDRWNANCWTAVDSPAGRIAAVY